MTHPVALVLGIVAGWVSRERRQRRPHLARALFGRLIHADHRAGRIIRAGVTPLGTCSMAHTKAASCWGGMHHICWRHGLMSFFFSTFRTVSWDIVCTTLRRFQTHRPAGATSNVRVRPAVRYRRWRPVAPRLRHRALGRDHGCAGGAPTPLPALPRHSVCAPFSTVWRADVKLVDDLPIMQRRTVLSLIGLQQDLCMAPTVGRRPSGLDQFRPIRTVSSSLKRTT